MGPIDRYKKYNHFPWKFLLHIVVIAVTSFQVFNMVNIQTDFAYNAQDQWLDRFMTSNWNNQTAGAGESITVYDITNLRDLVNTTVFAYFDIEKEVENQLDDITLPKWSEDDEAFFAGFTPEDRQRIGLKDVAVGDIKPIEGVARMIDKSKASQEFFLTEDDLGPFMEDNI